MMIRLILQVMFRLLQKPFTLASAAFGSMMKIRCLTTKQSENNQRPALVVVIPLKPTAFVRILFKIMDWEQARLLARSRAIALSL